MLKLTLLDFEGHQTINPDSELAAAVTFLKFEKGQTIFSAEDNDDSLYIILEGVVALDKYRFGSIDFLFESDLNSFD